jgi:hypothetical protein
MFATLDISCLVLTLDSRDLHPARSASLGSAHNDECTRGALATLSDTTGHA